MAGGSCRESALHSRRATPSATGVVNSLSVEGFSTSSPGSGSRNPWPLAICCFRLVTPQRPLQKMEDDNLIDKNKPHPEELCEMCQKLGYSCRLKHVWVPDMVDDSDSDDE